MNQNEQHDQGCIVLIYSVIQIVVFNYYYYYYYYSVHRKQSQSPIYFIHSLIKQIPPFFPSNNTIYSRVSFSIVLGVFELRFETVQFNTLSRLFHLFQISIHWQFHPT